MRNAIKKIRHINYSKLIEVAKHIPQDSLINFQVAFAEMMNNLNKDAEENEEYITYLDEARDLTYTIVNFINAVRYSVNEKTYEIESDFLIKKYRNKLEKEFDFYDRTIHWENYYDEDLDEYFLLSSVYWNRMQWVSDGLTGYNLSDKTRHYFWLMNTAIPKVINLVDAQATDLKQYDL